MARPTTRTNKLAVAAAVLAAASTTTDAFVTTPTVPGVSPAGAFARGARGAASVARAPSLRMSADDEVAKLRAAAQKARDEAQELAKSMGKEIDFNAGAAKEGPPVKTLSADEVSAISSSVDFDAGDAVGQTTRLDELVESGDFTLWKSAVTGSANTDSPSPLRTYPVSLNFLESRTAGKVTGETLGVSGEMDVNLDDFKDATIAVTLGSTVLAIASLAALPENIGATLCYLFALVPVAFIAVGSSAPGIIAGAIAASRGSNDDQGTREDRICRHEAGHFLCGYLCGLPVKEYTIGDDTGGYPCVEFHPSSEGEATGREFTAEEVATLSVVAMSGSVAEVLSFGQAKGGENDLIALDGWLRRSKEFVGATKQQDLTRWGALVAHNLIKGNMDTYERLVEAFKQKKSVSECVAVIEGR